MRTLAIGDIHGCFRALNHLAHWIELSSQDTVVALGDYVDRGPETNAVLDLLIELRQQCNLVLLRGNHEIMMMNARNDSQARRSWLEVGGRETLASYATDQLGDVPRKHWDLLDTTAPYFETESHFFVHANAYPDVELDDQPDYMLYWEFFDHPAKHRSGKTMVCGHTSQKSGLPRNIGHAICIDTYAHGGGWLTCLDTTTGRYWQTNQDGEKRADIISALEL